MTHRINSWLMLATLGGLALGPWSEADAALNSYLQLKGQKQGAIQGDTKLKGREGWLPIIAINHEVVSPRDPASGLATGKRQHKPLVLTMELGKASPQLYTAMFSGEVFSELALSVFAPEDKAAKTPLYTFTLSNASISEIKIVTPEGGQPEMRVGFTYQKITTVWKDGNIVSTDDWHKANEAPAPKPMPKPLPKQ
jgi:type VI secretion system secreted protein Hcp